MINWPFFYSNGVSSSSCNIREKYGSTLYMLTEFIETGKIMTLERLKFTKERDAFIENHEPLRQYFLKEDLYLLFSETAREEWDYSGTARDFLIVITGGYVEQELHQDYFDDDLDNDIVKMRNKVQEVIKDHNTFDKPEGCVFCPI